MAVYKPTNCTPFLTTFDCRVTSVDDIVFFECRIDTSNHKVAAYSVTIYDEDNNQVFPPDGSSADKHLTPISYLSGFTGNGIQQSAGAGVSYLIQSAGYTNLNTGLNGSYLKFPFILPASCHTKGDSYYFWTKNCLYYGTTANPNGLAWFSSDKKEEVGTPVNNITNGNSYKWTITLYQGTETGVTPPPIGETSYKYYDMLLTAGEVIGSYDERIQTIYSENVYVDYYIEPIYIPGVNFSDPTNWSYSGDESDITTFGRTRIKNVDSTYGYLYPQIDDYSYPAGTITREKANAYRIYQMGNDPDVLSTTRKVNILIGNMVVPMDWHTMSSDESSSYGEFTFYVAQDDTVSTTGDNPQQVKLGWPSGQMTSSNFFPFELMAVSAWGPEETEEEDAKLRWVSTARNTAINSSMRIVLNGQNDDNYGEETNAVRPFNIPNAGATPTSMYVKDVANAYNGIYTASLGGGGSVTATFKYNDVEYTGNFYEYTVTWRRTSDADTWGELTSKVVMVQKDGQNIQTQIYDDKGKPVIDNVQGSLNETPVKFVDEKPIQLYNYNTKDSEGDEIPGKSMMNTVGVIFYNGGENYSSSAIENKLYIRPFVGIQAGMYWIQEGNLNALNRQRFIISSLNTDYWYVNFLSGTSNGTYNISSGTLPGRSTRYQIKSYFRESDENPFDLYDNPTLVLKVYRNEAHDYDKTATTPDWSLYNDEDSDNQLYFGPAEDATGAYVVEESYGAAAGTSLLRVDRRSVWCEADYSQTDFISWRRVQWFLYSGIGTQGQLLQSSGIVYDGKLGYQFYGLVTNQPYTIVLVIETNTGLVLTQSTHIVTDFALESISRDQFPFDISYDCSVQAVYLRFGLTGYIIPNTIANNKRRTVDFSKNDTNPKIPGVEYARDNDGLMIIDGTKSDFPAEGVSYEFISSTLDDNQAISPLMTEPGDGAENVTFESSHIINATNSWGNIVGFDYSENTESGQAFENTFQIFLPDYNRQYSLDEETTLSYIDEKLIYRMYYQLGNNEFSGINIYIDKDGSGNASSTPYTTAGIWALTRNEAENRYETPAVPLIVSGRHQGGFSVPSENAYYPTDYRSVLISGNSYYSPQETEEGSDRYIESGFDYLGAEGAAQSSSSLRNSVRPLIDSVTVQSDYLADFMVLTAEGSGVREKFDVDGNKNNQSEDYFKVIGQAPALWSDNELERQTIVISGTTQDIYNEAGAAFVDTLFVESGTISREIENLDEYWSWNDGATVSEVNGEYSEPNDGSGGSGYWIDDGSTSNSLLYAQTSYISNSSIRTGMEDYTFLFHVDVKNILSGATPNDVTVNVYRRTNKGSN